MIGDLLMKISFHEKHDCRMPGGFLILGIALLVTFGQSSLSDAAVLSKEDFKLYGYVDASYTQNFNNPKNSGANANQLRIFDGDANSFRPNMAQ